MIRMAVLTGADHLGLVPVQKPERRHQLSGNLQDHFAVDLVHPFRLVFKPAQDPIPLRDDGGIDLEAVTAIEIVHVLDYH